MSTPATSDQINRARAYLECMNAEEIVQVSDRAIVIEEHKDGVWLTGAVWLPHDYLGYPPSYIVFCEKGHTYRTDPVVGYGYSSAKDFCKECDAPIVQEHVVRKEVN